MEKISLFLKQFGLLIGIGVVGLGILVYGVSGVLIPEKNQVEIVSDTSVLGTGTSNTSAAQLKVDVEGAILKPGTYVLPNGSRVGDALVLAGGLSSTADVQWVSQTLNLAEQVKDGEKIFVPAKSNNDLPSLQSSDLAAKSHGKINVNTASVIDLDDLSGIGEARAQAIIANRPYKSVDELVSKAKIPQSVYDKIKEQISVY